EKVVERIGHLKYDMLDPTDPGGQSPCLFGPGLEIPTIRDDDFPVRRRSAGDKLPCILRVGRQRLLDKNMTAFGQRGGRVFEMEHMRGRYNDRVHLDLRQHLTIILEASRDAEGLLNFSEFGG